MTKSKMTKCAKKLYPRMLRLLIKDAREITGLKKVPKHLRAAVKSHAAHLAKVKCTLGTAKKRR